MKNRLLHFLLVFAISFSTLQAQDIHFSQFFNSPLTLNPAQTGNFDGTYRVGLIYRDQYSSVNSPYKTISAGLDWIFPDKGLWEGDAVSVGLMMYNDKSGDGPMSFTDIKASGAYHKALGVDQRVTLGVQVGYSQKKLDRENLYFADQFDGTSFTNMTSNENLPTTDFSNLDFSVGLQYNALFTDDIAGTVGVTYNHVIPPNESFLNNANNKLSSRIVAHAESNIRLNEKMTVNPRVLYQFQTKAQEFSIGSDVGYLVENDDFEATFYGGAWFRVTGTDAIIPYIAGEYKDFRLGLSYDINVSSLSEVSNGRGGFEISLMYIGRIVPPPLTVVVPCLRF